MIIYKSILSGGLSTLLAISTAYSQGPLTPPGAPAPTMKTLSQVEPRTDIKTVAGNNVAEHVITQPGSYYLTGNIGITKSNGINIQSGGVTLDLMGFRIAKTGGTPGVAIQITGNGLKDITIRNGTLAGPGLTDGILELVTDDPINVRVSDLNVSGCSNQGIDLGVHPSTSVENCSVSGVGTVGINAGEIRNSTAVDCGGDAILASGNVVDSRGISTGGRGIDAEGNVTNSFGTSSGSDGISCGGNVFNSVGMANTTSQVADGIEAIGNVSNSIGKSNGANGIYTDANVTNSEGTTTGGFSSSDGIDSGTSVTNSVGESAGGDGINALFTVRDSYGSTTGSGSAGIRCYIANSCSFTGGLATSFKYNMP